MKNVGNILWGIILIVIGVIIGGNALDLIDVNIFFDGWWTLFIIIPSFVGLFNEKEKTGNIIGLLIGIVLLLCCQDIVNFELFWKLLIPGILIVIGLSFIFKDTFNHKVSKEIKKINKSQMNKKEYCATFSGENINFDKEKFEGTDLNAIFGGIKCDLRNAIIEKDVVVNASSIFGGIDIYVPEGIQVKVKSSSLFGAVDAKKNEKINDENVHTIYINAFCLFGGVEIK